jgi:hypothetical protein
MLRTRPMFQLAAGVERSRQNLSSESPDKLTGSTDSLRRSPIRCRGGLCIFDA